MPIFGAPPMSAADFAQRILADSDLSWDSPKRSVKALLYRLGIDRGFMVSCRKEGLPEVVDAHEWLLDMIWTDKQGVCLAVESEMSRDNRLRLDDFEKLMYVKSPLKLFLYKTTKSPDDGAKCHASLVEYMRDFSQNVEGEEYLLMEVGDGQAHFYHYIVPNTGSVTNVEFGPLELKHGSSA